MADHTPRIWPREHWREFSRLLKQRHPAILLVQVGGTHSWCLEGPDLCLLGKTSMTESTVILKHALLHVDGDSGLVHLRRQLGGKSVVLFGPTPESYVGYQQNTNIVAEKCGDCMWLTDDWNTRCIRDMDTPECMQSIRPQTVLRAVEEILAERKEYEYAVSDIALYSGAGRMAYEPALEDICRVCGVEKRPLSQTITGPCNTYIYSSKQWEYPYALDILRAMGKQTMKIADVGSGRGMFSWYLARQGHDVTAYDPDFSTVGTNDRDLNRRYIQFAKEQGFCAEFGDIFNLPAEDDAFDVVTCISVVEHIPYKFYALKEMLRVLKPGGKLILTYDLAENPVDIETGTRSEIFSPERIESLLQKVDITPGIISDNSALRRSTADIQADTVRGMPDGLTVGGLVLTKTRKVPVPGCQNSPQ
jgi:SAM-dependent methyltransferase